jgi:cellulose synthase/poly-beta-1,6-N-acetylglucosamine synthase-like glycosyltransferase
VILLEAAALLAVLLATLPVFAGLYQYLLVAASFRSTHLEHSGANVPRVAILIPAWNEDLVVGTTIDRLMRLDYPPDRLRVYVIDDGSTDETPRISIQRSQLYPGRVVHIRRVAGGEGKAHTLNYGLDILWASEWTEAVLIMDADVIYTADSLRKMARHLADPDVGAVTAYIKEGSGKPNWVQRFIGFEYITATGASRRAQNVLGFLACLSGGAQLHSRENLLAIGGRIFDDTLAEDTFTTFRTQICGRKSLFEPAAIVYAEEPDDLVGLWKQRLRWARGNVQITSVFQSLWGDRAAHPTLGSRSMSLLWFSIFLMPLFQISATLGLLTLWVLDPPLAWQAFRGLWLIAAVAYLLVTAVSFVVDPWSARRTWMEGILFPGLVSFGLILWSLFPPLVDPVLQLFSTIPGAANAGMVGLYSWQTLSMVGAWLAKVAVDKGYPRTSAALLYLSGYGAFLCAVTFGAYVLEYQGAARTWDKTVKTGKVS